MWGQAFSPDGRVLAAAYTSRIDLWDVADPARPMRLTTLAFDAAAPHWYGFPGDIAFSPDGHTLAATTSHNQVGLWNVTSPARAARIATAGGHTAPVAALAFSVGGHLLADIGYDGAVIVFNLTDPAHPARAATIRTVADPRLDPAGGYYDTQYALAFSPDGHTLTAIADSTALSPGPATPAGETVSQWRVTSTGAVTLITTFSRAPPADRPARTDPRRAHPGPRRAARRQHGGPIDAALTHRTSAPPGRGRPSQRMPASGACARAGQRSCRARLPGAGTGRSVTLWQMRAHRTFPHGGKLASGGL